MKKKVLSLFLTVTLVSTSFLETAWAAEPQAPSAVEAASASDSAADINLSTENTGENASADLDDSSLDGVSDDSGAAQSTDNAEPSDSGSVSDNANVALPGSEDTSETPDIGTDPNTGTETSDTNTDTDTDTGSDTEPIIEELSEPALVSVENGEKGVSLSWEPVNGANGYRIYRKDNSSDWTPAGTSDSTTFIDETAVSGTTYTYTVQAYRGAYEDAAANPDSKEYWSSYDTEGLGIYVLSAPAFPSAEHVASGIELKWNEVQGASTYKLYRRSSSGSWETLASTSSLSYIDKSSLTNDEVYYYSVQACSTSEESFWDESGTPVRKFAIPALKSAENADKGIKVTWTPVPNAEGYYVYRKIAGSSWKRIDSVSADASSYTDSSKLSNGTKYIYTVRAYEGTNRSWYDKNGVSELRIDTPVLVSADNTATAITIKWNPVKGATKYRLYRKTGSGSWQVIANISSTSYTDKSKLSNGTDYIYTVRAYKGSDRSYYDTDGITGTKMSIPALSKAENASGGIKITWKAVKGAEKYRVYRKTSGGSWKRIIDSTDKTSYTDTASLTSGTKYYYTVRAIKGSSLSYYNTKGVTETKLTTPTLSKAENASGGVKITWKSVKGAEKYRVYRKTSGGSWKRIIDSTKGTSYTDKSSLSSGTEYLYTVRAIKGSDLSYYDTKGKAELKLSNPSLTKAENTSSGIKITWKAVKGAEKYRVYRKTSGGSWKRIIDSTDKTSYTDTASLTSGTKYTYTVRAFTGSEWSWYNSGISVSKLTIPTLVKAENASGGIKVSWKSVKGASSYRVYRKTSGGSWKRIVNSTKGTSYTDKSSLSSGTKYYYTVRAIKGSDLSYYDTKGKAELKLSNPSLTKAENTSSGIKITWKAVKGAEHYRVYRKTSGSSWKRLVDSTTATSYTDKSSLSGGTKYTYTVRAFTGSEWSWYNSGISVSKLTIPTLVKAENASGGIKVTWKSVKGASSYRVYRKTSGGSWKRIVNSTKGTSYTDKSSLSSGTKYYYTVRAMKGSDLSYYNTKGVSELKLSNPSLTGATKVSGGIKVTWKSVKGAKGYYVYRKTSGSSWTRLASTKSTNYTDKKAKSGVSYVYTVRAYNGNDLSWYNSSGVTINKMLSKAQSYSSSTKWLILVDTKANKVGIYNGSKNNWTEKKYWSCTSGAASTPTVKGSFTVKSKGLAFGSGYTCWYYTQFYGNYLFHSVLYNPGSKTSIQDGRLGINASHGCVRLSLTNAKWIYDNIPRGTKVIIY